MLNIKTMLEDLSLEKHVKKYADDQQIFALKNEMFHPERAGNFAASLNNESFEKFIAL